MKYSALCNLPCIHCQKKLKRKSSLNAMRGAVSFYCSHCVISNVFPKKDPELDSKFSINYLITTGEKILAHVDIAGKLLVIEYLKGGSTIDEVDCFNILSNRVVLKITNYDLSNKEHLLQQLKEYLVFS